MAEFASNAKGNAALTTGIIGAAGVAMPLLSGLLGGMSGHNHGGTDACAMSLMTGLLAGRNNGYGTCSEDHCINRYEAGQSARIAELETEVKLRDANFFALSEMGKLRDYVDGKFAHVEHEICDQKVYNATLNSAVGCIQGQIAQLMSLGKFVIPNSSICPGWGDVTITPAAAPTTGA